MKKSQPIVTLKNASIFQQDKLILSAINLEIEPKEFVFLIGRVGSGKSSLIKTLYAELPLKKGDGMVSGYDLQKIHTREIPYLRRQLGIVFQDFQLLSDRTVNENLKIVLKATGWQQKDIPKRINEVLTTVGLMDKKHRMPHQLSGGEQQRTVIARAILNYPKLILADEPTGNLDPETSEGIMDLFNKIRQQGTSIIMATHNYSLIKRQTSRIIKLENKRLHDIDYEHDYIDFESLE